MRFLIALLLVLPLPGIAQSIDPGDIAHDSSLAVRNSADSSHHTDTAHLHYDYSGTGSLDNTNSLRSYIANNHLKLSLLEKSSTVNFTNDWVYGKQNDLLTNDDYTGSLDVGIYKTLEHFYYWGMANYTTSVSLLIHRQEQVGAGPGYNLIDKPKSVLLISDGIVYENGDLYDSIYGGSNGNHYQRDIYRTFRNSAHLLFYWVIRDRYTLDASGFWQNALSNWSDYNVRITGSFSIKLGKWLALTTAVVYNRFTRTRSRNLLATIGLTIKR